MVHRLVFLYHHGWLPTELDHINGNRSDNRIENLRPVTREQNMGHRGRPRNNKSGFKGVHWVNRDQCWRAKCVRKFLGDFGSPEEAARAYDAYALKHYGEQFAVLNFPRQEAT